MFDPAWDRDLNWELMESARHDRAGDGLEVDQLVRASAIARTSAARPPRSTGSP